MPPDHTTNPTLRLASDHHAAIRLLAEYGGFHDALIERLIQDYARRRVELHVDDVFSGLVTHDVSSGWIRFDGIEHLYCQIPFVGGEVRIEDMEVSPAAVGFTVSFGLTTTEWTDSGEFKTIRLDLTARSLTIGHPT
ncbi:MAG: hypothetical protein H6739_39655 [Alphaproteobacteria bacterium]|nr:hypothetical protein [Alphaproteobacteria bacterium]